MYICIAGSAPAGRQASQPGTQPGSRQVGKNHRELHGDEARRAGRQPAIMLNPTKYQHLERAFSHAGRCLNATKPRVSGETGDAIMFCHENMIRGNF